MAYMIFHLLKTRSMNKLLIVDDSYAARLFLANMLKDSKLDISFAENGVDALSQIDIINPDIMIIDLLMPVMDGIEVLERIKDKENKPSTVVLSADIQAPTKQRCLQLGAKAFMQKPVNKEELVDTINKYLNIS